MQYYCITFLYCYFLAPRCAPVCVCLCSADGRKGTRTASLHKKKKKTPNTKDSNNNNDNNRQIQYAGRGVVVVAPIRQKATSGKRALFHSLCLSASAFSPPQTAALRLQRWQRQRLRQEEAYYVYAKERKS